MQQIVSSKCHRRIEFQFRQFSIKGTTIGVIIIPKSDERPHHVLEDYFDDRRNKLLHKGTFFIRKGSSTDIATREDLDVMYKERIKKRIAEDKELEKHKIWGRSPKMLTERYADNEIRKQVTLEIYEDILKAIDSIFSQSEMKTKDQFYYEIKQIIMAKKSAKESEKYL